MTNSKEKKIVKPIWGDDKAEMSKQKIKTEKCKIWVFWFCPLKRSEIADRKIAEVPSLNISRTFSKSISWYFLAIKHSRNSMLKI